jgi:four helix bundle protein
MMKEDSESLFSFQELKVWQKSVIFSERLILTIDQLKAPRKHYRLVEQLESASTSVAMNIAEGKGRQTTKEFIQFLYIARGSLFEVITLLFILQKVGWIDNEKVIELEKLAEEITKMTNSLIKSLRQKRV